jgi:hypothetical protein
MKRPHASTVCAAPEAASATALRSAAACSLRRLDDELAAHHVHAAGGGELAAPVRRELHRSRLEGRQVAGDASGRTPADNQTVRNVFVIGPTRRSS